MHGSDTLQPFDADTAALVRVRATGLTTRGSRRPTTLFYPWLQGTFRYETVTPADSTVPSLSTGVFNVSALIRANVKAMVEYQRDLREGENHSFNVLLRFAF